MLKFEKERKKMSMKEAGIIFEGELLMVKGHPVSYEDQVLSESGLFLTDFGIDLPIEKGLLEFDDDYFNFMLINKVIKEL